MIRDSLIGVVDLGLTCRRTASTSRVNAPGTIESVAIRRFGFDVRGLRTILSGTAWFAALKTDLGPLLKNFAVIGIREVLGGCQ